MIKYLLSILYVIPLMLFWNGLIASILNIPHHISGSSFGIGMVFSYIIASRADKKGYSWWKNFLIFGFLSTGIPLIGIIKLITLHFAPENTQIKNKENTSIFQNFVKLQVDKFSYYDINKLDYKIILKNNSFEEYIELFENNRLNNIDIIMNLTESDYEKIGIKYIGDIKRLMKIFSKKEIHKNLNIYKNIIEKENNDIIEQNKELEKIFITKNQLDYIGHEINNLNKEHIMFIEHLGNYENLVRFLKYIYEESEYSDDFRQMESNIIKRFGYEIFPIISNWAISVSKYNRIIDEENMKLFKKRLVQEISFFYKIYEEYIVKNN